MGIGAKHHANMQHIMVRESDIERSIDFSLVDLVEGSGICETAVPNLIYYLRRLHIVFAVRPHRYRKRRPASNTFLVLIHNLPLAPMPEFPPEPTLTT